LRFIDVLNAVSQKSERHQEAESMDLQEADDAIVIDMENSWVRQSHN
jgi:hypothetical protein